MHEFLLFLTLADAMCPTVVTQVTLLRLLQDKDHPRVLIPELCRLFYQLGWVTGTGGGISLKQGFVCKKKNFFNLQCRALWNIGNVDAYPLLLICEGYFLLKLLIGTPLIRMSLETPKMPKNIFCWWMCVHGSDSGFGEANREFVILVLTVCVNLG